MRHIEQGVDDEQSAAVFSRDGHKIVCVSSRSTAGWDVVLQDAIESMRRFDERRVDLA